MVDVFVVIFNVLCRSRPRCSGFRIADSIAGCCCLAARSTPPVSRTRSACVQRPLRAGRCLPAIHPDDAGSPHCETPVEAAQPQLRVPFSGFLHHRNHDLHVALLPHHPMMQQQAVLVSHNAHQNPQFHRTPRLPLRDPARIGLEDRVDLFPPQQPALHLVRQLDRIPQILGVPGLRIRFS